MLFQGFSILPYLKHVNTNFNLLFSKTTACLWSNYPQGEKVIHLYVSVHNSTYLAGSDIHQAIHLTFSSQIPIF